MELYDEAIRGIEAMLGRCRRLGEPGRAWPEADGRSMIMRSDMAYELGGGALPAIGITAVTMDAGLVRGDGVSLLGPDLGDIEGDRPFARVALVRVREDLPDDGDALYDAIRELGRTRYRFYPRGFMLRVSAARQRESVRVGWAALDEGMGFADTGWLMVGAFHRDPLVEAVSLAYVTDLGFDYEGLAKKGKEVEGITAAIDHILANAAMECSSCSLQRVCDEVEGLRELHSRRK